MSKRAVIIVDLQKDYLATGSFALTGIDAAAANAARVVAAAREKGDRIVHVHHVAKEANSPLFAPGTDGIHPIATVAPQEGDTIIVKNFPNSFRETTLQQALQAGRHRRGGGRRRDERRLHRRDGPCRRRPRLRPHRRA